MFSAVSYKSLGVDISKELNAHTYFSAITGRQQFHLSISFGFFSSSYISWLSVPLLLVYSLLYSIALRSFGSSILDLGNLLTCKTYRDSLPFCKHFNWVCLTHADYPFVQRREYILCEDFTNFISPNSFDFSRISLFANSRLTNSLEANISQTFPMQPKPEMNIHCRSLIRLTWKIILAQSKILLAWSISSYGYCNLKVTFWTFWI